LRRNYDIDVQWVAFPLHPETPPEGQTLEDLFAGRLLNVPQLVAKLKKVADENGLPFGERTMTFNSRLAQELGKWAEEHGKGDQFHDAVFRAYFADGKNIAERDVLIEIVQKVGLPEQEALRAIENRSYKQAVDKDWSRSAHAGVTAVPTFRVDGRTLTGAQPYEVLEKLLIDSQVKKRAFQD
jgi:predicted DsbA family dithiol-disulfide isomerase